MGLQQARITWMEEIVTMLYEANIDVNEGKITSIKANGSKKGMLYNSNWHSRFSSLYNNLVEAPHLLRNSLLLQQ